MGTRTGLEPFGVSIDLVTGVMDAPDNHIVRKASDMMGYYADGDALKELIGEGDDPLHYEVFEKNIPEERGHLRICISKLLPGVVGEECFMTKGHYHTVAGTAEVYLCLRGEGLVLMKLPDGRCEYEPMKRNRMVYIPPYWAHRSVNTGDEPLIFFCVYPGDAGHNYRDIQGEGFPKRVFNRDGRISVEPGGKGK